MASSQLLEAVVDELACDELAVGEREQGLVCSVVWCREEVLHQRTVARRGIGCRVVVQVDVGAGEVPVCLGRHEVDTSVSAGGVEADVLAEQGCLWPVR